MQLSPFIQIPKTAYICIVVLCLIAINSTNTIFTLFSILSVPLLVKLLWRFNEPPVLFFGVMFQWLSITIKVFYADLIGENLVDIQLPPAVPETIEKTFLLSIYGLIAFALGVHLAIRKIDFRNINSVNNLVQNYDANRIIIYYIAFSVLVIFLKGISFLIPAIQQPIVHFTALKWAIFYLLFFVTINNREKRTAFYLIVMVEVLIGFTGYFSSFKEIIIITLISLLSLSIRLKPTQYIIGALMIFLVFRLSVVWTYIKPEYRSFLSGGQEAQIVTVSKTDALTKAWQLYGQMSPQNYDDAVEGLINRISYIEYFSASVQYVPAFLPFQHGEIWQGAIEHVLFPRFLNPNKPAIDDSEQTAKYTGLYVTGKDRGTSISLGYMAESYVDFGPIWMFLPIFLVGFLIGFIYRYLLTHAYTVLWGYGLVIPVYFFANINGMPATKILGAALMYFIVALICNKYLIPVIDKFLRKKIA